MFISMILAVTYIIIRLFFTLQNPTRQSMNSVKPNGEIVTYMLKNKIFIQLLFKESLDPQTQDTPCSQIMDM